MTNAGKYNHRISIYQPLIVEDSAGFQTQTINSSSLGTLVLTPMANVKTTRGMTIIRNGTDFERAYTNFTIRYPKSVQINRDMVIQFRDKIYTIEYLNNVDEANIELEMQCKEITH